MSRLKKILISVPDELLEQVDLLGSNANMNRSELIREAMQLYIDFKKKCCMRDCMQRGYEEMAEVNLQLAEMCFEVDCEIERCHEEKLAECE